MLNTNPGDVTAAINALSSFDCNTRLLLKLLFFRDVVVRFFLE